MEFLVYQMCQGWGPGWTGSPGFLFCVAFNIQLHKQSKQLSHSKSGSRDPAHKPKDREAVPGKEHPSQEGIREARATEHVPFHLLLFCARHHRSDVPHDFEPPHYLASLNL